MRLKRLNRVVFFSLIIFFIVSILSLAGADPLLSEAVSSTPFILKQFIFYIIGFVLVFLIYIFNIESAYQFVNWIYFILLGLLIILFLGFPNFLVETLNGSSGWIKIPIIGATFQPIEFMKVALIFKLALISKDHWESGDTDWTIIWKYLIYAGLPVVLVLGQPDLGGAILLGFTAFVMLLFSVKNHKFFMKFFKWSLIVFVSGFVSILLFSDLLIAITPLESYHLDRIYQWIDPYANDGYQLTQSLLAMGSAGLFGHGIGYDAISIPEPQTDFIFAVWAMCFGFVGAAFLIFIFFMFIREIFKISFASKDVTYKLLCIGFGSLMLIQVVENIGMTIGLLPITGIVLPYISYGGTALITYMVIAGIILNISSHSEFKIFK